LKPIVLRLRPISNNKDDKGNGNSNNNGDDKIDVDLLVPLGGGLPSGNGLLYSNSNVVYERVSYTGELATPTKITVQPIII
jgi:hypothetical protein